MPVYNSDKYLEESIKSIINQNYAKFEFIIISDDSSERTCEILDRYSSIDRRIKVYYNKNKLGLIGSLNRGCQLSKGEFIARMDADDISMPERLQAQVDHLERHPEIGILGSWAKRIDESGRIIGLTRLPTDPNLIKWHLIFDNCLVHPSVMMRRSLIDKLNFYSENKIYCEDYDMWTRASVCSEIANLPLFLLRYRTSKKYISRNMPDIRILTKLKQKYIKSILKLDIPIKELEIFYGIDELENNRNDNLYSYIFFNYINNLYINYLKLNRLTNYEIWTIRKDMCKILCAFSYSIAKKGSFFEAFKLLINGVRKWIPIYLSTLL